MDDRFGVVLDPRVARVKYEQQVNVVRSMAASRGWRIIRAEYPELLVEVRPALAVLVCCRNYDFVAPSVLLVDPANETPLALAEIHRRRGRPGVPNLGVHPVTDQPFFCIEGFWEYHDHFSHYNNPWLVHRRIRPLSQSLERVCQLLT